MLGRDRAAVRGGQPGHGLVDRRVGRIGTEHVHVQVADPEVAEDDHAWPPTAPTRPATTSSSSARNAASSPTGTATSILCGTPAVAIASVSRSR